MSFHVGQKVICIADNWTPKHKGDILPRKDAIYTVRDLHFTPWSIPSRSLRLVEIVNIEKQYIECFGECWFTVTAFRPLIERKTDISTLTALLDPANHKRLEPAGVSNK